MFGKTPGFLSGYCLFLRWRTEHTLALTGMILRLVGSQQMCATPSQPLATDVTTGGKDAVFWSVEFFVQLLKCVKRVQDLISHGKVRS